MRVVTVWLVVSLSHFTIFLIINGGSTAVKAALNCKNPMDIRDPHGVMTQKIPGSRIEYNPFPGGFKIVSGRSLHIEFRSDASSGLIFLVGNMAAADMVSVYLRHGHLTFARCCGIGRAFEIYRDRLDDKRWHSLTYYHSEKGGRLFVDGRNAFRQYHLGPCSDFTSVLFGGLTPRWANGLFKVVSHMLEQSDENYETDLMAQHRFSGCLRNMRIDDKIPTIQPHYFAVSECTIK